MNFAHEIGKNELVHFEGVISKQNIDSLLNKIETAIENPKWMKSVMRVSYDLITSGNVEENLVVYILAKSDGDYNIYCKHNKVEKNVAAFIDKTINKLKNYDENQLRELVKRLTERRPPISEKGTFFEDIIWSFYNIYRRKYAKIEIKYKPSENGFIAMVFMVNFEFIS